MRVSNTARWAEGLVAGLLAGLLGLLRPADPSFAGMGFLPQALASVLVAAFLGAAPGAMAFLGAATSTAALPWLGTLLGLSPAVREPRALMDAARVPAAAALCSALAVGWIRDNSAQAAARLLRRLRDLMRRNVQLKKMNAALSLLCEELERRVSGQRDSVSALYARIRKMDSQDLPKVLSGLLEAVEAFSQATSAAVYEYDPKAMALVRLASIGPEAEALIPLDAGIEGWVFRNNEIFSLRNVDDYLNLSHVDSTDSVLAFPLKAGDLPWGVLNVREMPFYRYNPITERNLGIVVELSSSYIKKAAEFRDRVLSHPRNDVTGLPSYGEFIRILGEELGRRAERRLSVAVVIVELLGFEELAFSHSGPKALLLLKEFAGAASLGGGRRADAFHYKAEGQLAFVLPDLDRNGASLFCLSLSRIAGEREWLIDDKHVGFEIAFGIAASPASAGVPSAEGAETLIAEAESVLVRSKSVFADQGGRGP
jgi:hypothetical protein